ncbi:conserved Plasmodium protein, unknown function [Plasmodium malariae]|uniref:Uncharacterized protein n=1 Tax=Plasmodium malariae TaxID=5858 RepID=A0A1C3KAD0_PLAMA|nr:conserved Plasmodium protein, unknown function [Plasmodium malariae]
MGVLKLKSEKKKKEKLKETKIDCKKCIKRTKIKDRPGKKDKENEFDISIFMKTDHASNKIRRINYGKLVKGIKKNKNIIANHIEKILEIYGMGITGEDENIRNYSSKIFYYLINSSIDYDIFFSKIKTCLFHSLKIDKVSLKVLNLELCYKFFFTKIDYCQNFFYEFLNNILDCFISLPIEHQVKNVKYFFLLFKYEAKYKRAHNSGIKKNENKRNAFIKAINNKYVNKNVDTKRKNFVHSDQVDKERVNCLKMKHHHDEQIEKEGDEKQNDYRENNYNEDLEDDYEKIIRRNMLNNSNDHFLIKKDIRVNIAEETKADIYTKLFKCLYNFMDEVTYNSVNVDLVHLYTKILKTIIFVLKKKNISIKMEMIIFINKFIKRAIEVINDNILNLTNWKVLNIIYYFILLVITLCLKEVKYIELVKKNVYTDYKSLIHYCFCVYFYIFTSFDFFKIVIEEQQMKQNRGEQIQQRQNGKSGNVRNEGIVKTDMIKHIESFACNKVVRSNDSDDFNRTTDYNENKKEGKNSLNKNYAKYSRKYFNLLIYFYGIYMQTKSKNNFLHFSVHVEHKFSKNFENKEKFMYTQKIIHLIEKKIKKFSHKDEVNTYCRFVLSYLKNFSEKSIFEMDYLCYYIIILAQKINAQSSASVGYFREETTYLNEKTTESKENAKSCKRGAYIRTNVLSSFSFLTMPFMFLFLVDCSIFINNNFFEMFYKPLRGEELKGEKEEEMGEKDGKEKKEKEKVEEEDKKKDEVEHNEDEEEKKEMTDIIAFLQNGECVNIITKKTFDDFINNLIFFLYCNYDNEFFKNNILFFFCLLKMEKHKIKKVRTCFGNCDNYNNGLGKLLELDIRNEMNESIYNKKEILIDHFLSKNNTNMLSFEIIKNLYFLFENTSQKFLFFIYFLIIKYTDIRSNYYYLEKKEAIVLLYRIFRQKIVQAPFGKVEGYTSETLDSDYTSDVFHKKCRFTINNEYLYREDFLIFFLKLNLCQTYLIFRRDVYSLVELRPLNDDSSDTGTILSSNEVKYSNIILILKKIAYIISNMNAFVLENTTKVNNARVVINYLLSMIKEIEINEVALPYSIHPCDILFITIKIVFLFYFTSFYLLPSLYIRGQDESLKRGALDMRRKIKERKKIKKRKVVHLGERTKLDSQMREVNELCEVDAEISEEDAEVSEEDVEVSEEDVEVSEEDVEVSEEDVEVSGEDVEVIGEDAQVRGEDTKMAQIIEQRVNVFYSTSMDIKIDVSIYSQFLKEFLSKSYRKSTAPKASNLEGILPYLSEPIRFFNFLFDKEIFYTSIINEKFENYKCTYCSYNLNTHKYVQELLNKFECDMKLVSFKKLLDLPTRIIIKLMNISIFKMSYNRNILYVKFTNNMKNLPNEYFYKLNFFLFFHHFIYLLIEKIRHFSESTFSLRSYYSISVRKKKKKKKIDNQGVLCITHIYLLHYCCGVHWRTFLFDVILCSYCIKEEVMKDMGLSYLLREGVQKKGVEEGQTEEEMDLVVKMGLKRLNELLRCTVDDISKKENKYFFPNTKYLIKYYL